MQPPSRPPATFAHQAIGGDGKWTAVAFSLDSLLYADFAAAAVLITFGVLLGKVSPLQMVAVALFEVVFFSLNESVLGLIGLLDVGRSLIVHLKLPLNLPSSSPLAPL